MAQPPKDKQPDAPPARRNRVDTVSRDAPVIGAAAFARMGFSDPALVLRWQEIVGPEIARVARPVRLSEGASGGTLTLRAEPAASTFLQHESRLLCGKINDWLGREAVSKLRFVQGPLVQRPAPKRRGPASAPPRPDDPAHGFEGAERLKAALLRLAAARSVRRDD